MGASHPSQRSVVKLRIDSDFDAFIARDGITTTLIEVASALGIPVQDIALIDLRKGCVILVISLPDEAAQQLLSLNSASSQDDPLQLLARTLAISKVTAGDAIEATELLKSSKIGFDTDLAWLHLSDLHLTSDYGDRLSDTSADLNRFLEDLPARLYDVNITPDAIFFTGDLVQSGFEEEYEVAEGFFADLQQALPESSRFAPMFIVPGNHDVTWSAIQPDRELELRSNLKSHVDVTRTLEEHTDYIAERQKNFRTFMDKLVGTLQIPPLDGFSFTSSFTTPNRTIRVGVAGFNSSWLSTRKDLYTSKAVPYSEGFADLDLQYLRLGSKQLRAAAISPHLQKSNIRIALMHHEPLSEWFAESDRETQRQELSRYDFILRGHQHETCARVGAKFAGADNFVELAPGALRTKPHWYQGFMTTELDLRAGQMRLRAWTVSGHARRWLPDPEFGNGGVEVRALPDHLRIRRAIGH
jgi:predicted MPP superfamily phosphohydrolase